MVYDSVEKNNMPEEMHHITSRSPALIVASNSEASFSDRKCKIRNASYLEV